MMEGGEPVFRKRAEILRKQCFSTSQSHYPLIQYLKRRVGAKSQRILEVQVRGKWGQTFP